MNIAVCDAHLELKGFLRMDGAWIGSIDIAQKKARTARDFNMDTRDIGPLCQPGQPLYCIEHSNQGLITFGGGVILKVRLGDTLLHASSCFILSPLAPPLWFACHTCFTAFNLSA